MNNLFAYLERRSYFREKVILRGATKIPFVISNLNKIKTVALV